MGTMTTLSPYLCCKDAARALLFYRQAFGATERSRIQENDGRIGHAELAVGEATIMLADEFPEIGFRSPPSLGGSPVLFHLCVADADAAFARAMAAGATAKEAVADHPYGERSG